MNVRNGGPGVGRLDDRSGYLCRSDRYMRVRAIELHAAGDGAGDDRLVIEIHFGVSSFI